MESYYHIARKDPFIKRAITFGIMKIGSEGKPSRIWGEDIEFKEIHTRNEGCLKIGRYYQLVMNYIGTSRKDDLGG